MLLWRSSDTFELFTDSAGNINLDCAAYLSGHWAQLRYLAHWKNKECMSDISFLQLVPILMALFIWTPQFVNKKLLIRIDNQALVFIINKGTSKLTFVMKLVRPMVLLLMSKNIQVRALRIPGVNNDIADSLSRFQLQRFRDLAPTEDQTPSDIHVEFLSIISDLK